MKLWRLWLLAYWMEKPPQDDNTWPRFLRLAGLTLALEAIAALWIAGALRPLSAL